MILVLSIAISALESATAFHAASADSPVDDQGVFVLSVAGREIGREKFTIRSSRDKIEARAEIDLHLARDGKTYDFKTSPHMVLNPELQPLSYTWTQKGSQASSLEVDFRQSPAKASYRTVTGSEDRRDFALPKDVVVLDDNITHHYELILDRYYLSKAGNQTFRAFIPQEALPGVLTVEDAGRGSVTIHGRSADLQHLVITTELTHIDLWVDEHQRLQLVAIPAAQLEAVRQE